MWSRINIVKRFSLLSPFVRHNASFSLHSSMFTISTHFSFMSTLSPSKPSSRCNGRYFFYILLLFTMPIDFIYDFSCNITVCFVISFRTLQDEDSHPVGKSSGRLCAIIYCRMAKWEGGDALARSICLNTCGKWRKKRLCNDDVSKSPGAGVASLAAENFIFRSGFFIS